MSGELTNRPASRTGLQVFFSTISFELQGFFACLSRGYVHRYATLIKQAKFETGNYTNSGFVNYNNGFSLHAGSYTTRRNGVVNYDGGNFSTYSNHYSCWLDRIEWDKRAGVVDEGEESNYLYSVMSRGYLGYDQSVERMTGTVNTIMSMKVGIFASLAQSVASVLHSISTFNYWWLLLLVLIALLFWWWMKKKKRK